eukprot:5785401-Amphidinium_carterae.1
MSSGLLSPITFGSALHAHPSRIQMKIILLSGSLQVRPATRYQHVISPIATSLHLVVEFKPKRLNPQRSCAHDQQDAAKSQYLTRGPLLKSYGCYVRMLRRVGMEFLVPTYSHHFA